MTGYIPDVILEAARNLRKNMTDAEKILWKEIQQQKLGVKFLRQKPVFLYEEQKGFPRYVIPDFCCLEHKIIIEVDGSIHLNQEVYDLDREKEVLLETRGFTIFRFTNDEVSNEIDTVLHQISASLI